jgi:hypothetical protein
MGDPPPGKRLDSWKEIAAYLKRDQRTVMRWAKQRGLPVHHTPGPGRGSVFAFTDEIDAWLKQPNGQVAAELPSRARTEFAARLRLNPVLLPAVLGVLALVATVLFLAMRRGPSEQPSEVRILKQGFEVLDRDGRVLWQHEFLEPLREAGGRPRSIGEMARVTDLDGDGQPEVIVVADFATSAASFETPHSILFCFSADGRLVWQWKAEMTLRFAGREFTGPWVFYDLVASPSGTAGAVWLAVAHHAWWPSAVVRVDPTGNAEIVFVNSGLIYAMNYVRTPAGDFVLAGGFNNGHDGAFLAVLAIEGTSGSSPQGEDSPFRAVDPPGGAPARYYLFPRSELNLLERQQRSQVTQISVGPEEVTVVTWEGKEVMSALYSFRSSPEFAPAYADYSDGYWHRHRLYEEEGRLDHTVEQCKRLVHPLPVREWRNGSWYTLRIPSQYFSR